MFDTVTVGTGVLYTVGYTVVGYFDVFRIEVPDTVVGCFDVFRIEMPDTVVGCSDVFCIEVPETVVGCTEVLRTDSLHAGTSDVAGIDHLHTEVIYGLVDHTCGFLTGVIYNLAGRTYGCLTEVNHMFDVCADVFRIDVVLAGRFYTGALVVVFVDVDFVADSSGTLSIYFCSNQGIVFPRTKTQLV